MGEILPGMRFQHKRTGGLYTVKHGDARVKIDNLCEWTPVVIYIQDGTDAPFVRNCMAFRKNFRRVP